MNTNLQSLQEAFLSAGYDHVSLDPDHLEVRIRDGLSCVIREDQLQHAINSGYTIEDIRENVLQDVSATPAFDPHILSETLSSFESVRDKLIIRPVSASADGVSVAVCRVIGDIALVAYILLSDNGSEVCSTKVLHSFADEWGVTDSEILQAAFANASRRYPPRVYTVMDLLMDPSGTGRDIMDDSFVLTPSVEGTCLSTTSRTNGATSIFYPGVAHRLAEQVHSDLYLCFTSVHEVMVHGTSIDPDSLRIVLTDTISEATPDRDVLTRHVYRYTRETQEFEIVA